MSTKHTPDKIAFIWDSIQPADVKKGETILAAEVGTEFGTEMVNRWNSHDALLAERDRLRELVREAHIAIKASLDGEFASSGGLIVVQKKLYAALRR